MTFTELSGSRQQTLLVSIVDAYVAGATENPDTWLEDTPLWVEGPHLWFQGVDYKRPTLLAVRYGCDQGVSIRTSDSDDRQFPKGAQENIYGINSRAEYKERMLRGFKRQGTPVSLVKRLTPIKAQSMELVRLLGETA